VNHSAPQGSRQREYPNASQTSFQAWFDGLQESHNRWLVSFPATARTLGVALAVLIGPGCERSQVRPPSQSSKASADTHRRVLASDSPNPRRPNHIREVVFIGACDASGAVELDDRHFVVADDEDNVLRVYDVDRGGPPLYKVDVSVDLSLTDPLEAESDLEAATRLGDVAYFLASHARTSKGKRDPNRILFFATKLPQPEQKVQVVGKACHTLLDDMLSDPKLARFDLRAAAELPPKDPGGFNLEGMTAQPDGSLLIGFRSPVPEGRALLVKLLNPREVLDGAPAQFSEPLQVDLGGLGVRALTEHRGQQLIVAGPSVDGGPFKLFRFDGVAKATPVSGIDFEGYAPEGTFTVDQRDEILVLSDDGTRVIGTKACKKLKDASQKSFRGVWVKVP
jgi:hypothetical protein